MKNVTYINAGAGSGKTYTLTRILSEKLSEQNNGASVIKPSQVILTTFTELAAAEFREKARQQILEAGNLDAAAQMDSAAIGTVHSVALRFIQKFWYLLDYGADIQIISERDEDFYMSQSLARIVSERDADGKLKKREELRAFRNFRDYYNISDGYGHPDYLFWQRYLNNIVEKMEYYNVDEVGESIQKSLDTIKAIYTAPPVDYAAIKEALKEYGDFCRGKIQKEDDKADRHSKTVDRLMNMKLDREWLFQVQKLRSDLCSPKAAAKDCVEFLTLLDQETISSTHCEIFEPFIRSVFSLAKEWRDDNVAYKKRKHIISYNDMERLFLYLITEKEEVINYIRDNYRLVMVDEFQDSNPIQLKIFNRLSEIIAESDGHSYWVGDPKQAIYGFRGADTDLVNSVSRHFRFYDDDKIHPEEGENHLGSGRLVESWRSRPTLVHLVNGIFQEQFKDEIDPLCITLKPHFTNDDLSSPAILHWHNEKQGRQQKVKEEALAWKVKELLNSKLQVHSGKRDEPATPIRPKDVAVLCRTNGAIKDIVKAMRKYDIPVAEAEDAIMQRIEVQLVVTLLQFMQNPNSKHAIADLMRLLWDNTTEDILRQRIDYVWAKDAEGNYVHLDDKGRLTDDQWMADAQEVLKLTQQTERFKHLSIPEMVQSLIYECNIPALASKWGDTRIRQQNLSTVQHLADDYDQMCLQMGLGTSINGFIYYLNSIEPDKEKDNQSDTVKVFTYHGSKGLEWPVVIMCELNEDRLNTNELIKKSLMKVREMVLCDKTTQQDPFAKEYFIHLLPYTLKGISSNPSQAMVDNIRLLPLYEQLRTRTQGEEKRLLYVGMTRAKDYLYTTGIDDTFAWLTNVGITNVAKDHVWGQENIRQDINVPSDDEVQIDAPTYILIKKPDTHTTRGKRYLSPSKLDQFEGFTSHIEWKECGTPMDDTKLGKDYATIGSCIHNIFAAYQQGEDEANRKKAIDIIGGYGMATQLAGHVDAILRSAQWLHNTLQAKFPQQPGDKAERELPFMMTLADGTTLRGEMDLLWHYTDAAGKHCVLIDYKSYPGVKLHEHTPKHYAQLSAYVSALTNAGIDVTHILLYYPIHQKIHELK